MRSASIFAKLVSPIDVTMRLSCAQNTTSLRKSIKMSNKNLLIRIYRVAQDSSKSFTILIVSSVDHKSSSEMILCNFFFTLCALFKVISSQFSYSATTYVEEQCFLACRVSDDRTSKESHFFG